MTRQTRISFSGLDGAGKSYQIAALVEELQQNTEVEVVWIPFEIWPQPLLNRLPASLRSRLGPERPAVTTTGPDEAPARPTGGLRHLGRVLLWTPIGCAAAVSAGLSLRRRAAETHSPVVVLDRYRLDSIVKLQYWYAEVSPRLLSSIVMRLAPRPTAELLLRVPPDEAYARKSEQWSVRQLRRQATSYDAAAAHAGALVIDGCQPREVVAAEVLRRVRALDGKQGHA